MSPRAGGRRNRSKTSTVTERASHLRDIRSNRNENDGPIDARRIAAKALDMGDIINKVRNKIVERGGSNGMRSIAKLLAIMDDNGDKRLSKDELKYGLRDYGVNLTLTELEQVFLYFDRDQNGFIDVNEFLVGIRGDLNDRRKRIVRFAFNLLDKDQSGEVNVDEILLCYDLNWHPEVRAGKMTVKEAARDFMKQWDRQEVDGKITVTEFEDYYKELSASIDDDDYFELMIRNAWRIAGGEGMASNTANKRVLVTNKGGSQSIQTIDQELGMRRGDKDDMRARLGRQGVQAEGIELYGGYEDVQQAKPGRNMPVRGQGQGRPQNPGADGSNGRPSNAIPRARPVHKQRMEAWLEAPSYGDQALPDDYDEFRYEARRGQARASPRQTAQGFDPFDVLHKLLYSPPVSIEMLCTKLQVSSVSSDPRVAQGAFIKR